MTGNLLGSVKTNETSNVITVRTTTPNESICFAPDEMHNSEAIVLYYDHNTAQRRIKKCVLCIIDMLLSAMEDQAIANDNATDMIGSTHRDKEREGIVSVVVGQIDEHPHTIIMIGEKWLHGYIVCLLCYANHSIEAKGVRLECLCESFDAEDR